MKFHTEYNNHFSASRVGPATRRVI